MRIRLPAALLALASVVACGDVSPEAGPGLLTATLRSPNGPEGAAVLAYFGPGIGHVTGSADEVYWDVQADTVRVVLVDEGDGELSFTVEVADTTRKPHGIVRQVAGPQDELRASLDGYRLEFRR